MDNKPVQSRWGSLYEELIASICTHMMPKELQAVLTVNHKWSKRAQTELFLLNPHTGNEWKFVPHHPQVGQRLGYYHLQTIYACTISSWDPSTSQMVIHYCGYSSSDVNLDLTNPHEASKLRPIQSSFYNFNTSDCQNAIGDCDFQRRTQPFKIWKMTNPQIGQHFRWHWADTTYPAKIIYVNKSRILFMYPGWTNWNTCTDYEFEPGAMGPESGAGDLCTGVDVVLAPHELADNMATRFRLRKKHQSRKNDVKELLVESLQNAKPGQPFLYCPVPQNCAGVYDLAFFGSYSQEQKTLQFKTISVADGHDEEITLPLAEASRCFKFCQKAFLTRGEMDLSFPIEPIDYSAETDGFHGLPQFYRTKLPELELGVPVEVPETGFIWTLTQLDTKQDSLNLCFAIQPLKKAIKLSDLKYLIQCGQKSDTVLDPDYSYEEEPHGYAPTYRGLALVAANTSTSTTPSCSIVEDKITLSTDRTPGGPSPYTEVTLVRDQALKHILVISIQEETEVTVTRCAGCYSCEWSGLGSCTNEQEVIEKTMTYRKVAWVAIPTPFL